MSILNSGFSYPMVYPNLEGITNIAADSKDINISDDSQKLILDRIQIEQRLRIIANKVLKPIPSEQQAKTGFFTSLKNNFYFAFNSIASQSIFEDEEENHTNHLSKGSAQRPDSVKVNVRASHANLETNRSSSYEWCDKAPEAILKDVKVRWRMFNDTVEEIPKQYAHYINASIKYANSIIETGHSTLLDTILKISLVCSSLFTLTTIVASGLSASVLIGTGVGIITGLLMGARSLYKKEVKEICAHSLQENIGKAIELYFNSKLRPNDFMNKVIPKLDYT